MGVFLKMKIGEMPTCFLKENLPCRRIPFFGGDAIADGDIGLPFRDPAELGGGTAWSNRFKAFFVPSNIANIVKKIR